MNSGRLYEHPNRSQSGFEDNIRMSQNKINKSSHNFLADESRNHDMSRHSDDALKPTQKGEELSAHNVNANASNSKIIIETESHSSITASEISDAIPETETMREQHELDG